MIGRGKGMCHHDFHLEFFPSYDDIPGRKNSQPAMDFVAGRGVFFRSVLGEADLRLKA